MRGLYRHVTLPHVVLDVVELAVERRAVAAATARAQRIDVALLEKHAAGGADGFLSAPEINAASDHAAAIKAGEFVFENASLKHPPEGFEVSLVRRGFGLF